MSYPNLLNKTYSINIYPVSRRLGIKRLLYLRIMVAAAYSEELTARFSPFNFFFRLQHFLTQFISYRKVSGTFAKKIFNVPLLKHDLN